MTQARSQFLNELMLLKSVQKDQKPISDSGSQVNQSLHHQPNRAQTEGKNKGESKGSDTSQI